MSKPTPLQVLTAAQKGQIFARAKAWNEPNRQLMLRVWRVLGHARAQALVISTQNVVATGGMLTADGSRPRTIGGIFFTLCRARVSSRERGRIFRPSRAPQDRPESSPAPVETPTVPIIHPAEVIAKVAPEVRAPAPATSPAVRESTPATSPRRPSRAPRRKVVTQKTPSPISERLLAQLEHKGWVVRDQHKVQRSSPV